MTRIILASSSPYRGALLRRLGLEFHAQSPQVDERPRSGESAAALAQRLAREKALAVAAATTDDDAVIIAADQAAGFNGSVLGKPGHFEAALTQLEACQGRSVMFFTASTVLDQRSGRLAEGVDTTAVRFRKLDRARLRRYLEIEQPYDCTGGFKAEGLGIALFDAIESRDPTGLLGLPLIWLTQVLRDLGVDPLDASKS